MKKLFFVVSVCLIQQFLLAQAVIYPTHWWVGMKNPNLQLIIHHKDIARAGKTMISNNPLIKVKAVHTVESSNYLIVDLTIASSAKPGKVKLSIPNSSFSVNYELKARRKGNGKEYAQGVHAADIIYFIMPDRFSNADPSNDKFADMRDTACDRNEASMRHGGDIQGVINHLDYIKDLGANTVWLTPVNDNDMPLEKEPSGMISGYHGYWITDQYNMDKRYGGNEAYKKLSDALHAKGMKLVQDAVYNHIGIQHWIMNDPPAKDWVNQWSTYTGSNHRDEAVFGAYASADDRKVMLDGWFTPHLPDVNQRNPYVANFLIQYAIWATEEFGVDAWRVDTYKYCDEVFLNRINDALLKEFPALTVFGEAWANTNTGSAYFSRSNINSAFKHNLQGVTDFPVQAAMLATLNEDFGWTNGVNRLYMTLSQDILYKDPMLNCIFLDNHDMNRYYTMIGEDLNKYKMGIAMLLTLRGIPSLYYGTEILMKNYAFTSDGERRRDFPGGFPGDKENKFESSGRTAEENAAFNFVKTLANFRLHSTALQTGNTMQYIPKDGLFVYFRYDKNSSVMVVLNTSAEQKEINWERYHERTTGYKTARNVIDNISVNIGAPMKVNAKSALVLELK